MALRLNNALRDLIVNGSISPALSGTGGTAGSSAELNIYSGVIPATPDTAPSGLLLVKISNLSWGTSTNGTAYLFAAKTGTATTAGVASFGRLTGSAGSTYVIDGDCGTSLLAAFTINATSVIAGSVVTLSAVTLVQPGS